MINEVILRGDPVHRIRLSANRSPKEKLGA